MRRFVILYVFCAAVSMAVAQKTVSVSGEFTYYAPANMSLQQAKQEALLQTRLNVLAAKFGTIINSTTNIHIENSEAEQAHSRTDVHTLATHEVKGEWIEDTRPPEQEICYDRSMKNTTIIRTRVWGRAREIVSARADVDVHLLKDTLPEAETDVFRNEQTFYLSFQSPVAGYVVVYLLDNDEDAAYCLLPTADDNRGAIPVSSNSRYIFFSPEYADSHYSDTDKQLGLSYEFTAARSVVFNQIYVIFSSNEFFKASDELFENDQYVLPRATDIKQFRQWLVRQKTRDTQLIEKTITVKIVK